ncbi:DUF4190 domain-containing protein [Streptomyces sp. TR06-5]|uniref:DUF4190 domain-containing protein n=1 Tax=unclassified Streptomyces TaxID=2593676 RepID=UPI0039A09A26
MTGENGGHGVPEGNPADPWAPPEKRVGLSKESGQPSGGAAPGSTPPGPGAESVGPPPPAPDGAFPPPVSPAGYGSGAGYGGYEGYGGYGGYPGYGGHGTAWAGAPLPKGSAVASMVLGIIGLVVISSCWGAFLGLLVAPVALVLGVSARRKADRGEGGGRSQATAGFVMGIVGTVLAVLIVPFLIWVLMHLDEFEGGPGGPGTYDARSRVAAATR